MGIYFCHAAAGVFIAIIFSLLYINFDKTWKKCLSAIITFVFSGGGLCTFYNSIGIESTNKIFWSIGIMLFFFIITFILALFIIARLIVDRNDNNILRIRDIILGQKNYIDSYYEQRKREISEKICPDLDKREAAISNREDALAAKEREIDGEKKYIEAERQKIKNNTTTRTKISLPENKSFIVSMEYLDSFPSYAGRFAECIHDLFDLAEMFKFNFNLQDSPLTQLKSYLNLMALYISKDLFGSRDVRVHFRYYDKSANGYRMLTAIEGEDSLIKDLTFIPYNKANMIKKSYECRRALIKSFNPKYHYQTNNHTIWKDYMTYAFYTFDINKKACLSFGISVRNEVLFKNLFVFLSHVEFETFLNKSLETFNEHIDIRKALYES